MRPIFSMPLSKRCSREVSIVRSLWLASLFFSLASVASFAADPAPQYQGAEGLTINQLGGTAGLITSLGLFIGAIGFQINQWRQTSISKEKLEEVKGELAQARDSLRRVRRMARHRGVRIRKLEREVSRVERSQQDSNERIYTVEEGLSEIRSLQDVGLLSRSGDDIPAIGNGAGNGDRAGGTRKIQVMIVDDDRDTTKRFGRLLHISGFDFLAAYTVADAIKQLEEARPHWILVDLCMGPDCNGLDVIRAARKLSPRSRCIVITGIEDRERLREAEALAPVIIKPVKLDGFIATLRTLAPA